MRGAIPPLPNTPSWCGAQLKKSTGSTLFSPLPLIENVKKYISVITKSPLQILRTMKQVCGISMIRATGMGKRQWKVA
jgi:hypothetical protein